MGRAAQEAAVTKGAKRQSALLVGILVSLVGIASVVIECEVPSILPKVTKDFVMDAAAASWLMSVFTFVGVVAALPIGKIAMLVSSRRLLVAGSVIILAGSLLAAAATDPTLLLAARVVQGVALVVIAVAGPAMIKVSVDPSRCGIALGIWAISFSIGSTVAGVATPFLSQFIGYKAVWISYGVVTLALSVLACLLVARPMSDGAAQEDDRQKSGNVRPDEANGTAPKPRYLDVFKRDSCLFLLVYLIFNMLIFAVVSYVPSVLQLKGYDITLSGFISTFPMLLAIVSGPVMGVVYDRVGYIKPLMLACLLSLGPFVFLMFNLTGTALWVAALLFGLFGMAVSGVLLTTYLGLFEDNSIVPLAMGIFTLVQGMGQFLGSFLIQALLGPGLDNWLGAGIAMMAGGFIASAAFMLCRVKRRQQGATR